MSKTQTITSEIELRQAAKELLERQTVGRWRWVRFDLKRERGVDALLELALDRRKVVFQVEFRLAPSARDVEYLAARTGTRPKLLIAPSLSEVLVGHGRGCTATTTIWFWSAAWR